MFRTDLNHWLQGFESEFMTYFMKSVSFLGLTYPIILAGLLVFSVFNFRKGLVLINIISITAALTVALKIYIDYPRPIAVDSNLIQFDEEKTTNDLTYLQPVDNFDIFNDELLSEIRLKEIGRYGLPSGHTAIQTSLWIGLVLLFRKKWLLNLAILSIVLTFLSRMYLGVHYPGDILGGLVLGLIIVFSVYIIANRMKITDDQSLNWLQLVFFLIPAPLYFLMPPGEGWQIAILIGINLAVFFSFYKKKLPEIDPVLYHQLFNFLTLTFLFLSFFFITRSLTVTTTYGIRFLLNLLAGYGAVRLWIIIALKLKWLKRI